MYIRVLSVVIVAVLALPVALYAEEARNDAGQSSFNPAISLILSGQLASFSSDPASYSIPGISLAEETGPGERGLSLAESELVISANIDDRFFGRFTAAFTPENTIEVEEAFIQTIGLRGGVTLKAGRIFSDIGYHNPKHFHSWDFVDTPLVYRALLGNRLSDDGVQLGWIAPSDRFIEVGAEVLRGDSYPAGGAANDGVGTSTLYARTGGDVGVAHSWRVGLSHVMAQADGRQSGDEATPDSFTGDSDLTGIDFVWKWAEQGNWKKKNAVFVAEYFQRREQGQFDPAGSGAVAYSGTQNGWYAQAVYGFQPRVRVGVRYDWLDTDNTGALSSGGHTSTRTSVMLDYSRSEYSRLRLQYNQDLSSPGVDNQVYLQYIMSLGAHGAHRF